MTVDASNEVAVASGEWDGVTRAYVPSDPLTVPSGLRLHRSAEESADPVSYEVIRHSLWNINQEHAAVLENLAVSTIVLETRDLSTAILTETGEILAFGSGVSDMAGWFDLVAKYLIEHKGERLAPGDIWLVNDPWIGAVHQPDVTLAAPLFHEGELFCWLVNAAHQNDVGGTVPGSFCPNAQDIYYDPPLFPPCRIVIDGAINEDVETIYQRQSRTPVILGLDLRAAIAGIDAARQRIESLVRRYGDETVKAVMQRMLAVSEESFRASLRTLPDGTWSERAYNEVAVSGERGTHRWELHLEKHGECLTFSNRGTEPQAGAANLTFGGWRGATIGALNVLMAPTQMGCIGGALRCIDFAPVHGTLSCADFGAAVSPAGVYTVELAVAMANSVVAKMLLTSSDPAVRSRAMTTSCSQWHLHHHAGINQRGDFYIGPMLDAVLGTTGACDEGDGEFANGLTYIPEGRGPNVETYERDWPILYLYRRRDRDSAGAGRWCGGAGGRVAYVPHRGEIAVGLYTAEGIPKTPALGGGLPGNPGETHYLADSNIRELFATGRLPAALDELRGTEEHVLGKGPALQPTESSVLEWNWGGSSGLGDPLLRDPELVRADVREGVFSAAVALSVFGVVTEDDDAEATSALRQRLRRERLRAAGALAEPLLPLDQPAHHAAVRFGDIWVDEPSGRYRCALCGTAAGLLEEHPKASLLRRDGPVAAIGPRFVDPRRFVDDDIDFREYFCSGCGTRHATEIARRVDPPLVEMRLARGGQPGLSTR